MIIEKTVMNYGKSACWKTRWQPDVHCYVYNLMITCRDAICQFISKNLQNWPMNYFLTIIYALIKPKRSIS